MDFSKSPICQSCGMHLHEEEHLGTNKDGSKNERYCTYCFKSGEFADKGISLQQKIDKNIEFGIKMGMTKEEAKNMAKGLLPNLER